MNDGTKTEELFGIWQRSMEQGLETWKRLFNQPQSVDMLQFWTLLFLRGLETWTQTLQQGGSVPDAIARWKKLMDESVESWAQIVSETMDSEGFAAANGRLLQQYLNAVGPLRSGIQAGSEDFYRAMNLPSRKQVTSLASQIVSIDARLEALEDKLGELIGSLASLEALLKQPGASPANHGRPAKPHRGTQRQRREM